MVLDKKIKKNFGFGCMRLPMKDENIDIPQFQKMVDTFMKEGFNYFDTAKVYISGNSELALKECLTSKYDRESYFLVDKLSNIFFKEEDLEGIFNSQLEALGVNYLDLYLMHAQNKNVYEKYKNCHAYEFALNKLKEGKIKHFGISFHDTVDVLEKILIDYPQIEVVQIQFNYMDYDDNSVQSKQLYELCKKYNKPCIIMEPVKGGHLVNLPPKALKLFKENYNMSPASLAIRFAASFENNFMVLSGMSNMEQMIDNLSYMKEFKPLNEEEINLCHEIAKTIKEAKAIQCTNCRYCVDGCPKHILIPDLFSLLNRYSIYSDWNSKFYYSSVFTVKNGKASECIKCGKCEKACPQKLPIRELLVDVKNAFE